MGRRFLSLVVAIFLHLQTEPILTSEIFEANSPMPSAASRLSFGPNLLRGRRRRLADPESESDIEENDDIALAKLLLGPKANRTRNYGIDIEYCRPQNEWLKSFPDYDVLPGDDAHHVHMGEH
jgi:hypothetical protein